jgi:hypothetical protein
MVDDRDRVRRGAGGDVVNVGGIRNGWFWSIGIGLVSIVFALMLFTAIVVIGTVGIIIVLAAGWLYRRHPVGAARVGTAWAALMLVIWNVNLVRQDGWTGVWTAVVLDLIVFAILVAVGYAITPEPRPAPTTSDRWARLAESRRTDDDTDQWSWSRLSESERIRREQAWS